MVPRDSAMQFPLIEQVINSTHAQKENDVFNSYNNSVSLYPLSAQLASVCLDSHMDSSYLSASCSLTAPGFHGP